MRLEQRLGGEDAVAVALSEGVKDSLKVVMLDALRAARSQVGEQRRPAAILLQEH